VPTATRITPNRIEPFDLSISARRTARKFQQKELPMMHPHSIRTFNLHPTIACAAAALALCTGIAIHAQAKNDASAEPDVLVLANGDTLHGKLVKEVSGKVTFHTDAFGDMTLGWDKIKELHTRQKFAVMNEQQKTPSQETARRLPTGNLQVENQTVILQPENGAAAPPIPVKDAQYIMDAATLDKQVNHEPGFFSGWEGAATAGATIVSATQKQHTFSGAVGLARTVPTVSWLLPRNRSLIDFIGSFGTITQPSYTIPGPPATFVPAVTTKSAIYHADAERDQYFSPRLFLLAQTAFDHNFSQDLDLQQIYGGGIGWTAIKDPKQQLDLKATMQYEKQKFISNSSSATNLVGSTYSASYIRRASLLTYTQQLAYIPAYNNPQAYSASEINTLAFPMYKGLAFSVGTIDSYLNNPPTAQPPTRRNSFQFTMGFTYAIKSNY
jgi:hypothetical protein